MKSTLLLIFTVIAFFSCKSKKDNFPYRTDIGSLIYQSELNDAQNTIKNYSTISEGGLYFYEQDSILEEKVLALKDYFYDHNNISKQEQDNFFKYFEKALNNSDVIDLQLFKELKNRPIKSISDINLLELYIKKCFASNLTNSKVLPFDMIGTLASADKWNIKFGEEFSLQMNTTASNSKQPAKWYIVKDVNIGLTKDNILDTLQANEFGEVFFKTKNYHKGENEIFVVVDLKTTTGNQILSKAIRFSVE